MKRNYQVTVEVTTSYVIPVTAEEGEAMDAAVEKYHDASRVQLGIWESDFYEAEATDVELA